MCTELFLESIYLLTEYLAAQILPAARNCQVTRSLVCHMLCVSIQPLLVSDSSPLSCREVLLFELQSVARHVCEIYF